MTQPTTNSIRIDKDLLEKIRIISKDKGQTISGYINVNLFKVVDRQWYKSQDQLEKRKKNNI